MDIGIIFPGQGAQHIGMAKDLYQAFPQVRSLFELVSDETGKDMASLIFEGSEEELQNTENTQLSVTLVNLSVYEAIKTLDHKIRVVAGFSLGEYSALVVSKVVSLSDAIRLVNERGKIMNRVSRTLVSDKKLHGEEIADQVGMTAVLGIAPERIAELIQHKKGVYLAMYNSPVQGVLAGYQAARDEAAEILKEAGARRIIPLKVSGPFHTPLMQAASDQFAEFAKTITFNSPSIAYYNNVDGKKLSDGDEIRKACAQQIVSPVQWVQQEKNISALGLTALLESGPGTVLSGLWRALAKSQGELSPTNITSISNLEDLNAFKTIQV